MKTQANGTRIVLQVGAELRVTNHSGIVVDNPVLDPLPNHKQMKSRRPND